MRFGASESRYYHTSSEPHGTSSGLLARVYRRFNAGHLNQLMQEKLIRLVDLEQPDWVHFRLPIEFDRRTIVELRKRGIVTTNTSTTTRFQESLLLVFIGNFVAPSRRTMGTSSFGCTTSRAIGIRAQHMWSTARQPMIRDGISRPARCRSETLLPTLRLWAIGRMIGG